MSYPQLPQAIPQQKHEVFQMPIVQKKWEGPDLLTITLDMSNYPGGYQFLPGQFNMLYAPGIGEAAISIASDLAHPEALVHTIAVVGRVTSAISKLNAGDKVWIRGPFGGDWPLQKMKGKHLILVGGGVGVPPLMGVVEMGLRGVGGFESVTLIAAAKSFEKLVYKEKYLLLQEAGIKIIVALEETPADWAWQTGRATPHIGACINDPVNTLLLTCGPEPMMKAVVEEALKFGLLEENCYISTERTMNCAIGICGRCQLGPHFTCLDGPVYPYSVLKKLMEVSNF